MEHIIAHTKSFLFVIEWCPFKDSVKQWNLPNVGTPGPDFAGSHLPQQQPGSFQLHFTPFSSVSLDRHWTESQTPTDPTQYPCRSSDKNKLRGPSIESWLINPFLTPPAPRLMHSVTDTQGRFKRLLNTQPPVTSKESANTYCCWQAMYLDW